jgi:uncharacterized coiled-coil DUF342 family protein
VDASTAGLIIAGLISCISAVGSLLFNTRVKWELETYKSGNTELREQADDHRTKITELKEEKYRLETQLEAKDITIENKDRLIEELKAMAQQLPAFTELAKQQRNEHKEVVTVLAKVAEGQSEVAKSLTELVSEIRGRNAISDR